MEKARRPWQNILLTFVIMVVAAVISHPFVDKTDPYWFSVPLSLAVLCCLWWGGKMLIAVPFACALSLTLYAFPDPQLYALWTLPNLAQAAFAWILLKERFKNLQPWIATPRNLNLFIVYGALIPSLVGAPFQELLFFAAGLRPEPDFFYLSLSGLIGDLSAFVFLTLPLLMIITPLLAAKSKSEFLVEFAPKYRWVRVTRKEKIIGASLLAGSLALAIMMPTNDVWYLYGILVLLYSAWYGVYAALFMNSWIFFLIVPLPYLLQLPWAGDTNYLQTPATLLTLSFCALITGGAVTSLTDKILRLKETENELKSARDQAEEASQAKSDFLARMSHEIRTPLNSVLGMLELLKETQLSKDQERYLSLFSHAGENLKALINDLLDFSKIEAKALTVEEVSFDFHSTIRSVFEILQIKAEEKGIHFELDISEKIPSQQWGDPTRLRQVLFNLVGNALKFTNEGNVKVCGRLTSEKPPRLMLEIQDTGIGIARDKQTQLFSPFFQAEPGHSRKFGGTGLGLVISKNLVEIMGGKLEMKSLAGRGTTFRVLLPHRPNLSHSSQKPNSPQAYDWKKISPERSYKILLVDDSEDNRVLMIHYLKGLPFECIEANNGEVAVAKFKQEKFDLVFMDMQMPVMTGYKATELIRYWEEQRDWPRTPIVALTATAVIEDLQRALQAGCDAYAVKPVKKTEILELLLDRLHLRDNNDGDSQSAASPGIYPDKIEDTDNNTANRPECSQNPRPQNPSTQDPHTQDPSP